MLLIVEDDITFARIMVDLAHKHGLKALIALRGITAINMAREFRPAAVSLDVRLPDMSGWTVLDYLKHDPATRHIPVARGFRTGGEPKGLSSRRNKLRSKEAGTETL